ncbi:MAG TPA: tetratricopeptide repeat protein [Spirochaetota bacterium]|nr:tetratricopeptide repeat protein [Spirochaetota bacterium]
MKITYLIFLLPLFLFQCSSTDVVKGEKVKTIPEEREKITSGWSYYSEGLYYKNLAAGSDKADERKKYVELAIDKMNSAVADEDAKGRVYHQLAELYHMKGETDKSEEYAKLSIMSDKTFFPPYSRLYSILMVRKKPVEASEMLEKYIQSVPDDPSALYMLGIHYFKYLNNTEKSLSEFEKIIEISRSRDVLPYYLENSYYNAGYIMYSKNEYRKGFQYFRKAYELNSNNMNTIYMMAFSAMGYYNLIDAEKYAVLYLKNSPGEPNMEFILGNVYYINSDDRALGHFARIRNLKSFEGLASAGLYAELTGDDKKAESIIPALMKYRKDMISPYIALAKIKARGDNRDEAYKALIAAGTACFRNSVFNAAEKMFYMAMEIKSDNNDIFYYLARTHEENKNYSMAISYYKRFYDHSKETDILVHIGYLYGTQKNYSRAFDYFRKAAELDPENPSPYFFMGLVNIWGEKYKDAKKNIGLAISRKNNEETYHFYMAVANEKLGNIDDAIVNLRDAIKHNSSSARAYNYLGYIYAEKNINIDEAFSLVSKALEYEPENGAYLDSLGWIYFRKGEYESALKYLLLAEEKLEEAGTPDYVVYEHIGDTYIKLGNPARAKTYYEKALKIEKNAAVEEKLKQIRGINGNGGN